MSKVIRVKRNTKANIGTLQLAEPFWATDENTLYVGDGAANHPAVTIESIGLDADLATLSVPSSATITDFGKTLVGTSDAAGAISALGLDADLATFSLPSSTVISAFAKTFLDDADADAVKATLEITSDGVVSIVTYGAVEGGVEDCAGAIQDAHDDLPATGGAIYIPAGVYAIESGIVITKPCLIYGDGWGSIIRANGSMTALFEVNAGGAGTVLRDFRIEGNKATTGGTIQRGIYINGATDCTIARMCLSGPEIGTGLNFGIDILAQASNRTKVLFNKIERLISSGSNGTAILIEYSSYNQIIGNYIDGTNGTADGAAIFLSATIASGGIGSSENIVAYNKILNHKQVGIDINSTTYYEWASQLGECWGNRIEHNEISGCSHASGGDASSGVVVVSNSPRNFLGWNYVHNNGHATAGGYGISITASVSGSTDGEGKMDEDPVYTTLEGNRVEYNQDDGIRILGAGYAIIKGNYCYENGQRTANTFDNISISKISGAILGSNAWVNDNHCAGSQVKYQIHIGADVATTALIHNYTPAGGTGTVLDQGTGTTTHP